VKSVILYFYRYSLVLCKRDYVSTEDLNRVKIESESGWSECCYGGNTDYVSTEGSNRVKIESESGWSERCYGGNTKNPTQ